MVIAIAAVDIVVAATGIHGIVATTGINKVISRVRSLAIIKHDKVNATSITPEERPSLSQDIGALRNRAKAHIRIVCVAVDSVIIATAINAVRACPTKLQI